MRRWVPGPARGAAAAVPVQGAASVVLKLADVLPRDLTFCSEFAVHGGLAASEQGFRAETELTRMQQAGLLVLHRDPAPPFAVLRVGLSPAIRDLLADRRSGPVEEPAPLPPQARPDGQEPPPSDRALRRNGFEVARGMISAAVKAEFSAVAGPAELEGQAGLERRVMTRISRLDTPFGP